MKFRCEFDVDIKHIKGMDKKVIDALNRRVDDMHASTISIWKSDLKTKILEVGISNEHYNGVTQELK